MTKKFLEPSQSWKATSYNVI